MTGVVERTVVVASLSESIEQAQPEELRLLYGSVFVYTFV